MEHVQLSLTPTIVGLLGVDAKTLALPLAEGRPSSLREILQLLEKQSPGALLEPRTKQLHRHIHVYVNRRLVSKLEQQVTAEDVVRVALRMIEGG
jgi:hypothetical protein|tara:strand:+ start:177 stop:461 length:285 start_codon:yes stop_codon:yes gene_type:complete